MEKVPALRIREKPKPKIENVKHLKAALFGAFLSSLPSHQAEAMDFMIGTDWLEGAVTMQYAAEREPNEFAGLYVEVVGMNGSWHNPTDGDRDSVGEDFVKDELTILEQIQIAKDPLAPNVTVCVAHTHPNEAYEGYLYGPSIADLNVDLTFKKYIRDDIAKNLNITIDVQGMVFEKHGVWYYSANEQKSGTTITPEIGRTGITTEDLAQRFTETIEDPHHTEHDLNRSILTVQLGLLRKGVKSRFVSYGNFFVEPPCAGVGYAPHN